MEVNNEHWATDIVAVTKWRWMRWSVYLERMVEMGTQFWAGSLKTGKYVLDTGVE